MGRFSSAGAGKRAPVDSVARNLPGVSSPSSGHQNDDDADSMSDERSGANGSLGFPFYSGGPP